MSLIIRDKPAPPAAATVTNVAGAAVGVPATWDSSLSQGRCGWSPGHQGPGDLRKVTCSPQEQGQCVALRLGFSKWPSSCYLLVVRYSRESCEMSFLLPAWSPVCSGESLPPLGFCFLLSEMRGWDLMLFKWPQRQPCLPGVSYSEVWRGAPRGPLPSKWNESGAWGTFPGAGSTLCTLLRSLPAQPASQKKKIKNLCMGRKKHLTRYFKLGVTQGQPASGKGHRGFQCF